MNQEHQMMELGYSLSSEEHGPNELIEAAARAEEAGFGFAMVSDHFHPWLDAQGQSPFVWSVLGGIARETSRLRVGTAVTCPLIRMHPAIVAQAAATTQAMFGGRFFLGVGTGERLNEHILGDRWPRPDERREMLEEAIAIMRLLWEGGTRSFDGRFYEVDQARLYTRPETPPAIVMAAGGARAAEMAGRFADGLISTAPSRATVEAFAAAGGAGKPRYGQLKVCWADSEQRAIDTVMRVWPLSGLPGVLNTELATPAQFEAAAKTVEPKDLEGLVVLGPDPAKHLAAIEAFADAGFDHVFVHQVGADQAGFLRFYEHEIMPALVREDATAGTGRRR
jgi:coenzyme F420-dependent glucose-6-phosphate dehydrogenase